jgi:hypothetical protein
VAPASDRQASPDVGDRLDRLDEKLDRLTDMVGEHHAYAIFAFSAVCERLAELLAYGRD